MDTKVCKEVRKGDRVYQFLLPSDAPIGEALDVSIELWGYMKDLNDEYLKKAQEARNGNE